MENVATNQEHLHKQAQDLFSKAQTAFFENLPDVLERVDAAIASAEQLDSKETLIRSLLIKATVYNASEQTHLTSSVFHVIRQLLQVNTFEEKTTNDLLMRVCYEEGNGAFVRSDFQKARNHYVKALSYAQRINDKQYISITHKNLGDALEELGDMEGALAHLKKSIQIYPLRELLEANSKKPSAQAHSKYQYAHLLCALAETCLNAGDYETAISYLDESQTVGATSPRYLMLYYRNYSKVLLHRGAHVEALKALEKSIKYYKEEYRTEGFTRALRDFGVDHAHLQISIGNYHEAVNALEQLQGTMPDTDKPDCAMSILLAVAYAKIADQHPALADELRVKARRYLDDAVASISSVGVLHMPNVLRELSNAKFLLGDAVGAYETLSLANIRKEDLYFVKVRNEIGSIRVILKLEREEHEKEIEQMKHKQTEQELSTTAMSLAMQTELLANFRNDLRQIVREIDEPIAALKKIKEKLKELPCEQIDWLKFEQEFTSVHPEFKAKLVEKYPDLTKQEVKMCQLARLGLKSFEMSRLLCISERSVETHRFNLRKKLGLKTEQNLTEFLGKV